MRDVRTEAAQDVLSRVDCDMEDGTPWFKELRNYGNDPNNKPRGRVSDIGGGEMRLTMETMGTPKPESKPKQKQKPMARPRRGAAALQTVPEDAEVAAGADGAEETAAKEADPDVVRFIFAHDMASMIELAFEQLPGDNNREKRLVLLNGWFKDLVELTMDLKGKRSDQVSWGSGIVLHSFDYFELHSFEFF